jgi:hypothetical protein
MRFDGERVKGTDTVEIDVPPIVSKSTQERALQRLAENRSRRDGRAKRRSYLLSGHIKCGACNLHYTGMTSIYKDVQYPYYRCAGRQMKNTLNGLHHRCDNWTVHAEWLEQQARIFLTALYTDPDFTRALAKQIQEDRLTADPAVERLATLEEKIMQIASRRARLVSALESVSGPSAKVIGGKLAELDREDARLRAEKRNLEAAPVAVRLDEAKLAQVLGARDWAFLGGGETPPLTPTLRKGFVGELARNVSQAGSLEFTRRRMREADFRAVVLENGTVDFSAKVPGIGTDVQSNVLAFWTLKRPG